MYYCVNNCEFIVFRNGHLKCTYYDEELSFDGDEKIAPLRCDKCLSDGVIGQNDETENIRKLKKYLSWLADSFYSHKDAFEESLADIYRLLKEMENNEKDRFQQDNDFQR